ASGPERHRSRTVSRRFASSACWNRHPRSCRSSLPWCVVADVVAHEPAVIDPGAKVGPGTTIWHFSHVMDGARIGSDCSLGQNVFVQSDVEIGDHVKIQNNVSIYAGVTLEDEVFCGPSMVFTNVHNPRSAFPKRTDEYDRTLVRHGATIGANATIVC